MEFLKILGEELYSQIETAINAHNGNEANKDNQIKLANLASGEYVGKGKYDAEVTASQGKDAEIENYKKAIADLQKANKGNGDIQQRISQLEAENAQLKAEREESDKRYAFEVLLMDAGVTDKDERDFLSFKHDKEMKEEGKTLELDENKHIKNGEEIVKSLKTRYPAKFTTNAEGGEGYVPVENNGLPKNYTDKSVTKEQFMQMGYNDRLKLKQENEQLYKQLAKN